MRIGVDMRSVYQRRRRGTGKNLLDLYTTMAERRPDWQFVMFHRGQGDDPFVDAENITARCIDMPGDRFNFWQRIRLPLAVRAEKIDVLHCPACTAPRRPMAPMALTIHDLIPLDSRFPSTVSKAWWRNVKRAIRRARRIITPSHFTRQNLVNRLHVPSDKVVVNQWAPDRACAQVTDARELQQTRERYGLAGKCPYLFGFGASDPRKNTRGLLEAWAKLPESMRAEHRLLLVGIDQAALTEFGELKSSLGLGDSCVLAGFAAEQDIPALLSGATALCYPSLSEGFGLPILDAFTCRTPVLVADATSLPEVAGDAAVLVDPSSAESIAEGLKRLIDDESLRARLVERGSRRVEAFTWEACADRAASAIGAAASERA